MYLLDTDHISLIQKAGAEGARIQARLITQTGPVWLSIVSFEEQIRGRLAESRGRVQALSYWIDTS